MKRCVLVATVVWVISGGGCGAETGTETAIPTTSPLESTDLTIDVSVRMTGTAVIHATVYGNPRLRAGANVLAVHGFMETGFVYRPLAQTIFRDRVLGGAVARVIAVDLPGHGDSGFPTGLPGGVRFGDLTIDDNVAVVLQVIDALRRRGLAARVVIGHSVGGLELQAAQEALLARRSSLAAHGVLGAVLLASIPPHGQPWHTTPGQNSGGVIDDPVLGTYFLPTPEAFVAGLFGTPSGVLVAGAPTPAEVVAARYIGPEPLTALIQLVEGTLPLPTGGTTTLLLPTVRGSAFAPRNGTLLTVVSFSEDTTVPPNDLRSLYQYLTGDSRDLLYRAVARPDAAHAMLISNPAALLDALRPML